MNCSYSARRAAHLVSGPATGWCSVDVMSTFAARRHTARVAIQRMGARSARRALREFPQCGVPMGSIQHNSRSAFHPCGKWFAAARAVCVVLHRLRRTGRSPNRRGGQRVKGTSTRAPWSDGSSARSAGHEGGIELPGSGCRPRTNTRMRLFAAPLAAAMARASSRASSSGGMLRSLRQPSPRDVRCEGAPRARGSPGVKICAAPPGASRWHTAPAPSAHPPTEVDPWPSPLVEAANLSNDLLPVTTRLPREPILQAPAVHRDRRQRSDTTAKNAALG